MKVQAEAAPPIPHIKKGTRLTGLVGPESPKEGAPQAPALPGGNAEGSLNPFSLTDGSTSGVILRAGAGISELLPAMRAPPRKGRDQNLPAQSNREVVRSTCAHDSKGVQHRMPNACCARV
jgi:hypothetical protein